MMLVQAREEQGRTRRDGVVPAPSAIPDRPPGRSADGQAPATEPIAARDDALTGLVARAVHQRASQPLLQRAIIAIDGPTDSALQLQATRNCLDNLQGRPTRGAAVGPALLGAIAPPPLRADETLYVLAHGSLAGSATYAAGTVGDLSPDQMGAQIEAWYSGMTYTGKIKLVACISAATAPDVRNGVSYADALRHWFAANAAGTFKPASVDGIIGVGWVDETTHQQQSIDTIDYLMADATAFGEPVSATREARITMELGAAGGPGSGAVRVTGKATGGAGKVRYDVPYPPPPAPMPAPMPAPIPVAVPAAATTAPAKKVGFFRGAWNALKAIIP
jgi:hypothetical protein